MKKGWLGLIINYDIGIIIIDDIVNKNTFIAGVQRDFSFVLRLRLPATSELFFRIEC